MTVDDIRERIKKKDIELYVQELLQFENSFDGFEKAIEPLVERLKMGRVEGHLHIEANIKSVQDEDRQDVFYAGDGLYSEKGKYQKTFPAIENGYCELTAFPCENVEWSEEEKEDIALLLEILYLHVTRSRLIRKTREYSYCNLTTMLPNSAGFVRIIQQHFQDQTICQYNGFYFNLKSFGLLSYKYGGAEGDLIIKRYAVAVRKWLAEDETLAHLGGDNFMALVKKSRTEEFLHLLEKVEVTAKYMGRIVPVYIVAAAGVYEITAKDGDPRDIMNGLSIAVSYARQHKLPYAFLTDKMLEETVDVQRMEQMLPEALEKREFQVYYQPKVDIRTGQIVGTEALARWIRNGEVIQPFRFIPTMERNGFIIHLDLYILKQVCEAINEWIEKGYKLVPISVNISRNDISGGGHDPRMLAERIIRIIKEYDIDPKYIIIEVTETTEASEQKDLYDFIRNMSEASIATSIDGFGTGCSTLSVLRDFPVNEIKIDRSFINHEAFSTQDQIIIKSIIQMARQLNLNVITEGVETEEQARFLLELGCNHAQGYLYDKPLEQSVFESRLSVGGYDRKI
ncbi:MAG: bifunctional diguanylate cyclase/phosphodiesterase [Coprococcus sp.]|nr:bifunctional diguanylate cyclase/phosphodiesterase [Coprococcus sp.]